MRPVHKETRVMLFDVRLRLVVRLDVLVLVIVVAIKVGLQRRQKRFVSRGRDGGDDVRAVSCS